VGGAARRRVLVIGLDCLEPSLVFERWQGDLPHLGALMTQGAYGRLASCHPPITVPAWSSMLTGRDPGELGFYGFRNRADHSYDRLSIANSTAVRAPRVWELLSAAGRRSVVIGVPQTYPVRPLDGWLVSDFLTPPGATEWTYPSQLAAEVTAVLDGQPYEFDVKGFRTPDKAGLLESIYRMTRKRWRVVHHLVATKPWDFFMLVEMGTDRIHHGFWSHMDPGHHRYEPGNPFESAIHDYYVFLDAEIGRLLAGLGEETLVMVVSDHGAQRMVGGFCINEWLMAQGYLTLAEPPAGIAELDAGQVDWSQTTAWGSGGYYARVFLNVAGREPQGTIPAADVPAVRARLKAALEATTDPDGRPLGTQALVPAEIYREVNGVAPDLIVYFGGLAWRSVGSVGHAALHTFENDTGPDDANHAPDGLVIACDPQSDWGGTELVGAQLERIAPTLLGWLGVEVPEGMMGRALDLRPALAAGDPSAGDGVPPADAASPGYSAEEEEAISRHLADLGYL
jgi:predicted AlkP superfamily phosphohydrolase/phosphomutase